MEFYIKFVQAYLTHILTFIHIAFTVMFEQPTYSVNENTGPAQPVLVLSNPSSMTFSVTVTNTDGSATGKYHLNT